MSNDDIILRQQILLARSQELRSTLADQTEVLKKPLAWIEQIRTGVTWLRHNPQWPLGALALVVLLRPRRAFRWGGRLWWGWQTFSRARSWLHSRSPQT